MMLYAILLSLFLVGFLYFMGTFLVWQQSASTITSGVPNTGSQPVETTCAE